MAALRESADTVPLVPLGELCRIVGGGTPSKKEPTYYQGIIPWVTVKDFTEFNIVDTVGHITDEAVSVSATNVIPADTVLVVTRVGLGKVAMTTRDMAINQDIKALFPDDRLLPEYLFWNLVSQANEIQRMGVGATVKGITLPQLKSLSVPLPSHNEQRRIVDILKRADGIRRLRKQAQETARQLIPALFIDMFGDPTTNPKGWPVGKIGELGRVQLGRQRTPKYQTGNHTRPYVRVANVYENKIDISDVLSMDFNEKDFAQYRLESGDILLNEGQSTELVGRPAMWRGEIEDCCFQNTLVRFQPTRERMTSEFALAALLHYYHASVLSKISSKTSNIAHLGAGRFAKLELYCPPLDMQRTFSKLFDEAWSVQNQQTMSADQAEASFQSLLHQAFQSPAI